MADKGDNSNIDQFLGDVMSEASKSEKSEKPEPKDGETSAFYTESPKDIIAFRFGRAPSTELGKYKIM